MFNVKIDTILIYKVLARNTQRTLHILAHYYGLPMIVYTHLDPFSAPHLSLPLPRSLSLAYPMTLLTTCLRDILYGANTNH